MHLNARCPSCDSEVGTPAAAHTQMAACSARSKCVRTGRSRQAAGRTMARSRSSSRVQPRPSTQPPTSVPPRCQAANACHRYWMLVICDNVSRAMSRIERRRVIHAPYNLKAAVNSAIILYFTSRYFYTVWSGDVALCSGKLRRVTSRGEVSRSIKLYNIKRIPNKNAKMGVY